MAKKSTKTPKTKKAKETISQMIERCLGGGKK